MVDVTITTGYAKYDDDLNWPPNEFKLYGYLPSHWPNNKIPLNENEAKIQAVLINKNLWHDIEKRWIYKHNPALPKYQVPQFENGSGPPIPSTPPPNMQITVNSWLKTNWKWLVPVALGAAFIISRR